MEFPCKRFETRAPKAPYFRGETRKLRQRIAVEGVAPSDVMRTKIHFGKKRAIAYRFLHFENAPRYMRRYLRTLASRTAV